MHEHRCKAACSYTLNPKLVVCLAWQVHLSKHARHASRVLMSYCVQSGPQPEGGNRAIAPPKFLKKYVFVRYSNKLHHLPPENISWLRPCVQLSPKIVSSRDAHQDFSKRLNNSNCACSNGGHSVTHSITLFCAPKDCFRFSTTNAHRELIHCVDEIYIPLASRFNRNAVFSVSSQ